MKFFDFKDTTVTCIDTGCSTERIYDGFNNELYPLYWPHGFSIIVMIIVYTFCLLSLFYIKTIEITIQCITAQSTHDEKIKNFMILCYNWIQRTKLYISCFVETLFPSHHKDHIWYSLITCSIVWVLTSW